MLPPPSTSSPIELPALPLIVPDSKTDYTPRRKIFSDTDLPNWLDSEAYYYIELIIARLSVAVDGKKVEDPCPESPVSVTPSLPPRNRVPALRMRPCPAFALPHFTELSSTHTSLSLLRPSRCAFASSRT